MNCHFVRPNHIGLLLAVALPLSAMACVVDELTDQDRSLTLNFAGDGEGSISILVQSLSGDPVESVECTETCTVTAAGDSRLELAPQSSLGSNFLGWDRRHLADVCQGLGICEFLLYGHYAIELDFSTTRAAIELDSLEPFGLSIDYTGTAVTLDGRTGNGRCIADECVFVAEVGSVVHLNAGIGVPADLRWHEVGSCGEEPVLCVVPLSDGPTLDIIVTQNRWYGVSLADSAESR